MLRALGFRVSSFRSGSRVEGLGSGFRVYGLGVSRNYKAWPTLSVSSLLSVSLGMRRNYPKKGLHRFARSYDKHD